MTEEPKRHLGKVDRVNEHYGFLVALDGTRLFFHRRSVFDKRMPTEGDLVYFTAWNEDAPEGKLPEAKGIIFAPNT